MNTEDFVTYEQAVKLKKIGFNWECNHYYDIEKELVENRVETIEDTNYGNFNIDYNDDEIVCSAPTLAQTQKWLREKHYFIEPISLSKTVWTGYFINYGMFVDGLETYEQCKSKFSTYNSYEEVLIVGIDRAIEELEYYIDRAEAEKNIKQIIGKYICVDNKIKYKDYIHIIDTQYLFGMDFQAVCGLMVDKIYYFDETQKKYVYREFNDGGGRLYDSVPFDNITKNIKVSHTLMTKDEFDNLKNILEINE